MNICCPDTSFLISLLDEDDSCHNKAIKAFKNIKFGEIYITGNVAVAYIHRSSKNAAEIISIVIEKIETDKKSSFDVHDINTFMELAKKNIRKKYNISDTKNLIKNINNIRKHVENIFNYRSCGNRIGKKDISSHLILLKNALNFEYINKFSVLEILGYKSLNIKRKAEEIIRKNIGSDNLKGLNDSLILTEIIKFALSDSRINFNFYLFDKESPKKGKN